MNNRWILGELALECCFYAMSRSARRILKLDPKDDLAYVYSYQCRMDSNEIQLSCRPPRARTVTLMSFYHLLTRDLLARPFAIGILKLIIVTGTRVQQMIVVGNSSIKVYRLETCEVGRVKHHSHHIYFEEYHKIEDLHVFLISFICSIVLCSVHSSYKYRRYDIILYRVALTCMNITVGTRTQQ